MLDGQDDMSAFKDIFKVAKNIVVLSGAGISAESGIPTFRGSGGFWRTYKSQDLATPGAFRRDPSLVWEFYHYRRELVFTKKPNAVSHFSIKSYIMV
jgi:NAD-dependent SIR2 family protein deacetylase